jgi:hypothetical protein
MEYTGNAPAGVWVKSARSGQGANCLEFMFSSDGLFDAVVISDRVGCASLTRKSSG